MIITIDGPSGTGKSTVARNLSKLLKISHLDSGAIYRALAWYFISKNIELDDEINLKKALPEFSFSIDNDHYFVDDMDITSNIRTEQISKSSSNISKYLWLREAVLPIQKKLAMEGSLVAEGRDMGTVVFPEAEHKIYLTATPSIRALRRFEELKRKGFSCTYDDVLEDIEKRDYQDSNRTASPLKPANNAIIIDTSHLRIEEVINEIKKTITYL